MPATKKSAGKGAKRARTSGSLALAPVAKIRLTARARRPAVVQFLDMPPTFKEPKRIHSRRVLPLVREGAEREYYSTTPRTILVPYVTRAAPAPSGDLVVRTNTELTQPALQQTASNVDEPSCSLKGNVAFYTGNWYAAMSANAGATFQYIDPATAFKAFDPPNSNSVAIRRSITFRRSTLSSGCRSTDPTRTTFSDWRSRLRPTLDRATGTCLTSPPLCSAYRARSWTFRTWRSAQITST